MGSNSLGSVFLLQRQMASHPDKRCERCSKSSQEAGTTLRRCTGCQLCYYCSKECQKSDWPRHKQFCYLVQGKGAPNAFLTAAAAQKGQEFVYGLLIDSYRLRVERDHEERHEDHGIYFRGGKLPEGNVFAEGDVEADFQNYLDRAEMAGVLPKGWDIYGRMECLILGLDRTGNKKNVFARVQEDEFKARDGTDPQVSMILVILAELVVGYEGKGPPSDRMEWFQQFKSRFEKEAPVTEESGQ